ncbi:MAG: hypothetical protein RR512_06280 [Coprobacillus sp.]
MKKNGLKYAYYLSIIIYLATLIYAFIINWQGKYMGMCFVAIITPLIFPVILKLLKIKVPYEVLIINVVFIYFASLIGSCLGGYSTDYFDKFTHFASGIVICELGYMIYKYYIKTDVSMIFMVLVINAINMMVAALWELYEYALLVFVNNDAIRHYTTGVHDSMTDILVCLIGGILLTLYLIRYDSSEKDHFFVSLVRKTFELNKK